ncbi:hypothetical protein CTAYLR_009821 [Chrysophaeum taylorii]|uniref:Isocitrate lyase n=1 Tax=Chrysophaeum taylorii TaxID=2483200 RepID=A0AAD7XJG6_9STRA|nr:hypothetical protein CTAYLR_009821 [Chrysophaeum taylorii]
MLAPHRAPISVQYRSRFAAERWKNVVSEHFEKGTASVTYGCTDPAAIAHMSQHLETVYVSGWQAASLAATDGVVGPDFADYPLNTVPTLVSRLARAQEFHAPTPTRATAG